MKYFISIMSLIAIALFSSKQVYGDDLWDIVEEAQLTIQQKYPSKDSIARKMALKELEEIAGSDKTDEQKIVLIRNKYPIVSTEMANRESIANIDINDLSREAQRGNAMAQNELAERYSFGRGVNQNYVEAVKWYRRAAEQGYAEAQRNLGDCYLGGRGVKQDDSEAFKWTSAAAKQGNAEAQCDLAMLYFSGRGVKQDYAEAVKWYRKAIEQGNTDALEMLAFCYENGMGVEQDYVEAANLYRKAIDKGDINALVSLGFCYYEGKGVVQNYTEAFNLWKRASENNSKSGQLGVALCYYLGKAVKQDYLEAAKWLRKAADQGSDVAQKYLGECYYNGRGVKQDKTEAMKWYRKAAEQGNREAKKILMEIDEESDSTERPNPTMDNAQKKELFNGRVDLGNDIVLEMVKVEHGTFTMGKLSNDSDADDDETPHNVTLTKDYWLGKYEVTQEQWKAVMGNNPSFFKGDRLPAELVSWNDIRDFCNKLNAKYSGKLPSGYEFRLPTEAEWEYAAKGGKKSNGYKYSGSNTIEDVAWFVDNFGGMTHEVGTKKPNELGLYDMSGNVLEWCYDWYGEYSSGSQTDPIGSKTGSDLVFRGGCWGSLARGCRSSGRYSLAPSGRTSFLGFRLALAPVPLR